MVASLSDMETRLPDEFERPDTAEAGAGYDESLARNVAAEAGFSRELSPGASSSSIKVLPVAGAVAALALGVAAFLNRGAIRAAAARFIRR